MTAGDGVGGTCTLISGGGMKGGGGAAIFGGGGGGGSFSGGGATSAISFVSSGFATSSTALRASPDTSAQMMRMCRTITKATPGR